ncbi:cyclophane-forming radical SAM/SPASM peptide maturase GrrM/OscB [Bacillus sp. DX1.1]|uniref:cyclophane-forming radical SAM/SPASM peptide maturase GrrM/OscB n=1 Tax=unclassified Bacillus (in: firmicutes) TaxID=185979 RepID=UPI002570DA30|nr:MULTISPECIES: cyclophane-forming radical SAM/SPASM peptide maturase GrrM/OscB [unclassified Bacillus (in: firmicutes)]MDM5153340.1 cyclophane-forming radical SAM/SPASM peptide maturase GrrM/OscB [Bacillus sp. DX1.1]WJE82298.1 cyclophane-forming radical SAM/SPASM peptide maturase GrrM/OscB [Bacillus sp. DX3.1]
MTIKLIVLQPTSLCNLNCQYCYVPGRKDSTRMSEQTLENVIAKVLRSSIVDENVEFLWHAGEPLTVGIDFYKKVMTYIQKHNNQDRRIRNRLQTNGTLLTPDWCEFLLENDFQIGISIDGPAMLHNRNRIDWSGKGSHHLVMRGLKLLKEYGLSFGGLCVLTRESLNYPREIFNFFYSNGFQSVGFNVEEIENANKSSSLKDYEEHSIIVEKYRSFMSELFDLWKTHKNEIEFREFRNMLTRIEKKLSNKNYYSVPDEIKSLGIITIQKNGDITTNSPEFAGGLNTEFNNFVVGNINAQYELDTVVNSNIYNRMQHEINLGVKNCASSCLYFDLCGGGSPSNKYFENGSLSSTETIRCILHHQTLTSIVIEKLLNA